MYIYLCVISGSCLAHVLGALLFTDPGLGREKIPAIHNKHHQAGRAHAIGTRRPLVTAPKKGVAGSPQSDLCVDYPVNRPFPWGFLFCFLQLGEKVDRLRLESAEREADTMPTYPPYRGFKFSHA